MRVYPDTNVWLYALERHEPFNTVAEALLAALIRGPHQIVSSPLVVGELLVLPRRTGDHFIEASYRHFFSHSRIMMVTDIRSIAAPFADARAHSGLTSADALHIAAATVANADVFVTEDRKLLSKKLSGIARTLSIQQTLTLLQGQP